MRRRCALALLLATALRPARAKEAVNRPAADERQRQLEEWWAHQRQREAADRFWNGPREQRRNLTRDQVERWERQRLRGRGWPLPPF